MKRSAMASFLALVLLLVPVAPGLAWRGHSGVRTRVFVGVGPAFWWGPYWWGPYWWQYPPYYVYPPPPVVVQEPPVYVQREPPPTPAPQSYWYYCESAKAYYPTVPACPEPWVKVPPRPEP
jgi:hypothetical protein